MRVKLISVLALTLALLSGSSAAVPAVPETVPQVFSGPRQLPPGPPGPNGPQLMPGSRPPFIGISESMRRSVEIITATIPRPRLPGGFSGQAPAQPENKENLPRPNTVKGVREAESGDFVLLAGTILKARDEQNSYTFADLNGDKVEVILPETMRAPLIPGAHYLIWAEVEQSLLHTRLNIRYISSPR